MPPVRRNVVGAMFDVKPVDATGRVDVARIGQVSRRLNLAHAESKNLPLSFARIDDTVHEITVERPAPPIAAVLTRDDALQELEGEFIAPAPVVRPAEPTVRTPGEPAYDRILAEVRRSQRVLARRPQLVGTLAGSPAGNVPLRPRNTGVLARTPSHALRSRMRPHELPGWFHAPTVPHVPAPLSVEYSHVMHPAPVSRAGFRMPHPSSTRVVVAGMVALFIIAGGSFLLSTKRQVIESGTSALSSLEDAQEDIGRFDFESASANFAAAYEDFTRAGERLDDLGTRITSWVAELPGGQTLTSAQHITKVGALIADTGKAMAQAVSAISKTGFLLNPNSNSRFLLSEVLGPLKEALALSNRNLSEATVLLAGVDTDVIPEEKRPLFDTFKERLPDIASIVNDGQDYVAFLESVMGTRGTHRYLLLFQNTTELRPAGGFPGNYGVLTVENGTIKKIVVDDVYNLDGQLKEWFVPPIPLQHITPTWGMRDTNWFIDFPVSARKAMAFFRKEAGYDVEGVITISPKIIQDILSVVGPIEMPEYDLTLTSENFLPEIQNEVEYGENKLINKPKKIVADLAPMLLAKLYSAPPATWLEIFQTLVANIEQKEMIMYFNDSRLQDLVTRKGFGGHVSQTDADYLMVTASNVKGAKTDAVTDTQISLDTEEVAEGVRHVLRITRTHNGGNSPLGFYNRQNPSYVRVLVPQGARVLNVTGASEVNYKSLVDYSGKEFIRDPDLVKLEETFQYDDQRHIATYAEAGRTGFALWMVVDPGTTKTVEIEYLVPEMRIGDSYRLLVQKQPGLVVKNFEFHFDQGSQVRASAASPRMYEERGMLVYRAPLTSDLPIQINLVAR